MPYNIWAIYTAAAHADAALPPIVRAAASCLILPNLLNGYWAYLMLNGFVKLLVGGGKKKKGKKDATATATAAAGIMEPSGLSDPPRQPQPPPQHRLKSA